MKKKDIKFLIIFVAIVCCSFAYLYQATYAKYRRSVEGNIEATIAGWNVKVNNEMIKNKVALTNSIIPTFDADQYTKAGVLAPGTTGYFDIVIDPSEVDVDFTYEISKAAASSNSLADFILTDYEIDNVKTTIPSTNIITGDLVKNSTAKTIRVYATWVDDQTETMNNSQDTQYAQNNENAYIDILLHFYQKN